MKQDIRIQMFTCMQLTLTEIKISEEKNVKLKKKLNFSGHLSCSPHRSGRPGRKLPGCLSCYSINTKHVFYQTNLKKDKFFIVITISRHPCDLILAGLQEWA